MKTAAPRYATGRRAKAMCPRCGLVERYENIVYEPRTNSWVCRDCYDPKALDDLPARVVSDAVSLHHPKPVNDAYSVIKRLDPLPWALYLWAETPKVTVAPQPTGQAMTFALGTVGVSMNFPVTGVGMTLELGEASFGPAVSGVAISATTGTPSFSGNFPLVAEEYLEDGLGNTLTDHLGNSIIGTDTEATFQIGQVTVTT